MAKRGRSKEERELVLEITKCALNTGRGDEVRNAERGANLG